MKRWAACAIFVALHVQLFWFAFNASGMLVVPVTIHLQSPAQGSGMLHLPGCSVNGAPPRRLVRHLFCQFKGPFKPEITHDSAFHGSLQANMYTS